jgi:hypothetical protein
MMDDKRFEQSQGTNDYNVLSWVFHDLGVLFTDQSKLEESAKMYQRALIVNERALSGEHLTTLFM